MRYLYTLLFLTIIASCVRAQNWTEFEAKNTLGDRRIVPTRALTLETSAPELQNLLFSAPHENTVTAKTSATILDLLSPDGQVVSFSIVAYDIAEKGSLTKYPNIRTWYGVNPEDPTQSVFLDWTSRGFHASVRGGSIPSFFVDPIYRNDLEHYQVYGKADLDPTAHPFTCFTEQDAYDTRADERQTTVSNKAIGECELMQYRTTMTTTGEYSNWHGATSAAQSDLVQSAIVTTVNRVNQITTRNLSLRLLLVGNNDELYNYDSDNDPFPLNEVGSLINENTPYVDGIIGNENYDYGHIVSQGGGGGVASLGASCQENRKAAGATSLGSPEGDYFDVDYVAHEMGHNFGGNHTQNNDCNYSPSAGMEPGSGSTIMSYAGICSPNVQGQVDDYYHGRSIEEMTTHFELGSGGCGTIINVGLNNATIESQTDETIPAGTPFVLKSGATGNGTINYNWEQYNVEQGATMPPLGTNVEGPLFRTLPATANPERWFPRLPDVLAGTSGTWEATPTVSREMEFRSTVLNYNATYGCAVEDNVDINVDASGGPFIVLDPTNGSTSWNTGQVAPVSWDIAATRLAPISSILVDVLLSTDGGATFEVLLEDTPNDGYAEVIVPNQTGAQNRVMVRSKDNVFYNVNSANFSITTGSGAPAVALNTSTQPDLKVCFNALNSPTISFLTTASGGATSPITWSVAGLPAGVTESFSTNPSVPGEAFDLVLENLDNLPEGTTMFTLNGISADGTFTEFFEIEKFGNSNFPSPTGLSPNATAIDIRPTLSATSAGNLAYDLQIATDAAFTNLIYSLSSLASPEFTPPSYLEGNTIYYWRIRSTSTTEPNECNASTWSEESFTTDNCSLFSSSAAAQTISDDAPPISVEMDLLISETGLIRDVDVFQLNIFHTYLGDLDIELEHPDGTTVQLWDQECGGNDNIFASFDDESTVAPPCPPVDGEFYSSPVDPLSGFDGKSMLGNWTIRVVDNADQDGGSLRGFTLKVCKAEVNLPVTFLSFQASPKKDHILLDWSTADEVNNRGFTIERSATGLSGWTELGFVPAGAAYTFPDETALAHTDYFYRLRQEDLDGRVSYSAIRTARFGESTGLVLFPNPTGDELNYHFPAENGAVPYDLIEVSGRILAQGVLVPGSGTLNLRSYPAGVYFLRVAGEMRKVTKL